MAKSRQDLYRKFLDFIASDVHKQRSKLNRRLLSVFFWCFFVPAALSAVSLLFVKLKIFPPFLRTHLDWLVLIFPVTYSLYVFGSEVLAHFPKAMKKGGMAGTLAQAVSEGAWRERMSEVMLEEITGSAKDWEWIASSFRMDLRAMQYRTRYLTVLAGAIFFIVTTGIDSLMGGEEEVIRVGLESKNWVNMMFSDLTQLVGLGLFLTLLYLSGSQTYHALLRYLNCAELILRQKRDG